MDSITYHLSWTWIHSDGDPRCPDKSDQSYCLHKVGHRMMLELTILLILIGFSKGVHRMFRQHQPGSQNSWLRILLLWAEEYECGAQGWAGACQQAGPGEGGHGQNMHGEVIKSKFCDHPNTGSFTIPVWKYGFIAPKFMVIVLMTFKGYGHMDSSTDRHTVPADQVWTGFPH